MKTTALLTIVLCAAVTAIAADPAPAPAPAAPAVEYKKMPWHLIDLWWHMPGPVKIDNFSIDVTVDQDLAKPLNIYISPIGWAKINGNQCYGGIQTDSDGGPRRPELGGYAKIGPGALFSQWGQRDLAATRITSDGYCQSSGHEGDFISVRAKYPWSKGKYTMSLIAMDRETIDGKVNTWVGMFIYSHKTDQQRYVGAMRFPGDGINFDNKFASFFEIYGPAIPTDKIPHVNITFDNVKLDGKPAKFTKITGQFDKGIPDYAAATATEGAVNITVGTPVTRDNRYPILWQAPK